jgi:hypothetical protein
VASIRWEFWKLSTGTEDAPCWLAASRPDARSAIDHRKLYTLFPQRLSFIANWYATEDHERDSGSAIWVHEFIELEEARQLALEVPKPSDEHLARIARPEAVLALDQIDRFSVESVLGKRVADALTARRPARSSVPKAGH